MGEKALFFMPGIMNGILCLHLQALITFMAALTYKYLQILNL